MKAGGWMGSPPDLLSQICAQMRVVLQGPTASATLLGAISPDVPHGRDSTRGRTFHLKTEETTCPSTRHSSDTGRTQRIYTQPWHTSFLVWWGTSSIGSPWANHFSALLISLWHPNQPLAIVSPCFLSFIALHHKLFVCFFVCSFSPSYEKNISSVGVREFVLFPPSIELRVMHRRHLANTTKRMNIAMQCSIFYKAFIWFFQKTHEISIFISFILYMRKLRIRSHKWLV